MRYLVTGHTGFKGAWLSLMLRALGHDVLGIALDPEPGSLYERAAVAEVMSADVRQDIRDPQGVRDAVARLQPEVIVHLAAQALVRESYRDPRRTHETNIMGTYNVLEAAEHLPDLAALLVVTTDKVYRNTGKSGGYVEEDALGGVDPYSASKAAADVVAQSWIATHPGVPAAIVRAGNVVGGGDVCADRLMVDTLRSFSRGEAVRLRFPEAVRPWQHVLDCLKGYLSIIHALQRGEVLGEAFNIGPDPRSVVTVGEVTDRVAAMWGEGATQVHDNGTHPHEAGLLTLDAGKAQALLGWANQLDLDATLRWTVEWARRVQVGEDPRVVTLEQIGRFFSAAGESPTV